MNSPQAGPPGAFPPTPPASGFAARLRAATRAAHADAEGAGFVDDLLAGRLARGAHVALLAQNHLVYAVLEDAWAAHRDDPVVAPLLDDALRRLPSLEADLRSLAGPGWRALLQPSPATRRYVERLRAVAFDWPGGFVAHHYLRYLGDLSGGQVIRRLLERAYGASGEGLRSYDFPGVAPKPYRDRYRRLLDAAPWSPAEQELVIAEVAGGYRLNREVFDDLGARSPAWRRPGA
ncbi:heme oxygenase (biliverdin-producing) [Quadrisphaera sp. DSM 44207]|uniref:biliverdin-producing heme oxygenase n=1 Tax=Quadrisphaera sp. DSM 44207 TaxID=1881057 RepID=UPI0008813C8F|nr:biliverdin-producing heme oxygenase [Quadrisphaera sp. DSM 44207]SDQ05511.1 heme oxygenase [Quadrisphaera sp. DSM 44207]